MRRIHSLSLRLSLNILLFVSLLFIGALVVMAMANYKQIAAEAENATRHRLHAMVKEIEAPLVEVESATSSAGKFVASMMNNEELLYRITQQMVLQQPSVCGSAIAFAKGQHGDDRWFAPYSYEGPDRQIHSIQLGNEDYDYYDMEWFRVPYETGMPHWSNPYYDEGGGNLQMTTYSYPVKDSTGRVFAVVTADVPVMWLHDISLKMKPYERSFITLLCPDGSTLAATDSLVALDVQERFKTDTVSRNWLDKVLNGNDSMDRIGKGRNSMFMAYEPMRTGWAAVIVCRYSDVLHDTNRMLNILMIIGLVGLLILFLLCYLIVRRVTRPITELTEAARSMSGGNLNVPLPDVKSHDEVLELRDSFAYMQKSLTEYIKELKDTTAANNRMEGELSVASDIQMGMLSTDFPSMLHAKLVPAKQVGGDLYDFVVGNNGIVYFAIGDVSGKGAPAALMMSITRAALHFVAGMELTIEQVMSLVNNSVADANSGDMFVTLFIGRLHTDTGVLEYCNGGHNPIIVVRPDGRVRYLKAKPNLALGVMADYPYEGESLQLERGTRLLLYTDGVTEAEREDNQQYGEGRLLAWAGNRGTAGTEQEEVEALYESVKEYTNGNPQNDDITIMSLKY